MSDNLHTIEVAERVARHALRHNSSEAASLMAVISRAASDPSTDGDKLERLLGLYERIAARSAKAAYTAALAAMQDELPVIASAA